MEKGYNVVSRSNQFKKKLIFSLQHLIICILGKFIPPGPIGLTVNETITVTRTAMRGMLRETIHSCQYCIQLTNERTQICIQLMIGQNATRDYKISNSTNERTGGCYERLHILYLPMRGLEY